MSARLAVIALALAAVLPGRPACAQTPLPDATQLTLEQLTQTEIEQVVGASKVLQDVRRAPSWITIVRAREIKSHGYRTLADALRNVPGLYVSYDRNYEYLGGRGFARADDYNTRVLLLIDGHRMNDATFDGALIGTDEAFDMSLVDRIEVIRGPGSSLYGSSAFFAVINVIMRPAADIEGTELEGLAAGLGTWQGRATWGRRLPSGTSLLVSATGYASDQQRRLYFPEFDAPETNHGVAEGRDGDGSTQLYASAALGHWSVQALYGRRTKHIPTGSWGTIFNDPTNQALDARGYVDVTWGAEVRGTRIVARGGYDASQYDGDYAYEGDEPGTRLHQDDAAIGRWLTGELLGSRELGAHRLTGGVEYRWNVAERFDVGYIGEPPALTSHTRSTEWGLYVQDEWRVGQFVSLNGGLRYDGLTSGGGGAHVRGAVILTPRDGTTIKALFGTAFRAPNPYEIYYAGIPPARPLDQEHIRSTELVWEQGLGTHVHTALSAFKYQVDDLIVPDVSMPLGTTEQVPFMNGASARAHGLQAQVELLGGPLSARVAETVQRSRDGETGARLANSPLAMTQALATWSVVPNVLTAAWDARFIGDRLSLAGTTVRSAIVQNVAVTWRPGGRGPELTAGASNVFDRAFYDPGLEEHVQDRLLQNGRCWFARVRHRF